MNSVWKLLSKRDKFVAVWIFVLFVLIGLIEVLSIASVMPFIAILSNPDLIETNELLRGIYNRLQITQIEHFWVIIGMVVLALQLISGVLRATSLAVQLRFSYYRHQSLSKRLLEKYLGNGYLWLTGQNTAELSKNILSETHFAVIAGVLALLRVASFSVIGLFILILLISVDALITVCSLGIFGTAYGLFYALSFKPLQDMGHMRFLANSERFKKVAESFDSVRELTVKDIAPLFISKFGERGNDFAHYSYRMDLFAALPIFLLEIVAFSGLVVFLIFSIMTKGGIEAVLPSVALFAFAGYRLLPALNNIYSGLSQMRSASTVIERLNEDLTEVVANHSEPTHSGRQTEIQFEKRVLLQDIYFSYPLGSGATISGLTINIPRGKMIALIGPSGSGKSTLADMLLGLIPPDRGTIQIDETILTVENMRLWQSKIGFVPQDVRLIDDSIGLNIAFGEETIDSEILKKIKVAADRANIASFIETLEDGYDTAVGDKGIRLSGGQVQRIGLARSLYNEPEVLILDEATSALDAQSEARVMQSIEEISAETTLIVIAHRLNTVRKADYIFMIKDGTVAAEGTYEHLENNNEVFRAFAANQLVKKSDE